ncbi:MAG: hypothetical protein EAZ89_18565, partial [Bacteroidetes bacterium]
WNWSLCFRKLLLLICRASLFLPNKRILFPTYQAAPGNWGRFFLLAPKPAPPDFGFRMVGRG